MSSPMTTFESQRESLQEMLKDIGSGKYQLPDFQRGWVWDDSHIISLLASVSMSYPIGAVMTLEAGNADVRFKTRTIEGVNLSGAVVPAKLILDGQQRLTSLYQALYSNQPVVTRDTRGNTIKRWYYIDIAKILDPAVDAEEAIFSVPEDRIVRNFRREVMADYSSVAKECVAEVLPLRLVFDTAGWMAWQMEYVKPDGPQVPNRYDKWPIIFQEVVQRFQQYQVPVIALKKETPKEAVCQVFEKVNTGGVSLTVFELLTATYAADGYSLREDWNDRRKELHKRTVLSGVPAEDFLAAVTLFSTWQRMMQGQQVPVSAKRRDMLRLPLSDYKQAAGKIVSGYEAAAQFLYGQRIFAARDVPYHSQLIPLAAIFATFIGHTVSDTARQKIARWYWCGVLGELYGSATESRFARDLPEVIAWLGGGVEPSTISDCNVAATRIYGLRNRNSAAYKGLHALMMRHGALDFATGEPYDAHVYFDKAVDIHHIFPRAYCQQQKLERQRWDCIVNKTPLSAETNRSIGGSAPSIYLRHLKKKYEITDERMGKILESHLVPKTAPAADESHLIYKSALATDDFATFFTGRMESLLHLVETVTGKVISRSDTVMPSEITAPDDEDEPVETLSA